MCAINLTIAISTLVDLLSHGPNAATTGVLVSILFDKLFKPFLHILTLRVHFGMFAFELDPVAKKYKHFRNELIQAVVISVV